MTDRPPAICIVQARMSSTRLPGKVLADLGGLPMLTVLLRRLQRAKAITKIIVATSDTVGDDLIAAATATEGIECYRGSLLDVAGRFVGIAQRYPTGCLVRISGDSPFSDPALIDEAVDLFWRDCPDLLSSSNPRTTPHGLSIEVISARTLCAAYPLFEDAGDKEHVTRYFYRHPHQYRIASFAPSPPFALTHSLAIDTPEDLARAREIVTRLNGTVLTAGGREIVRMTEEL